MKRTRKFWWRITDGLAISQLWKQFQADARLSYRLFAQGIDMERRPGTGRVRHFFRMARQFFWAVVESSRRPGGCYWCLRSSCWY